MTDSTAILRTFDTLAIGSRYAYLTNIEGYLAGGDYADAVTALNSGQDTIPHTDTDYIFNVRIADSAAATYIVENYVNFYRLYINYMNDTLSGSDSLQVLALAQLCPERNGTVVYQARALYSLIYNDLSMFNDDSCINIDTTYIGSRYSNLNHSTQGGLQTIVQQYSIVPNPNNGNMVVLQAVSDNRPVNCEIWDELGRIIYKQGISFISQKSNLVLGNITPGLYIMQLRDVAGREFRFKFVVE